MDNFKKIGKLKELSSQLEEVKMNIATVMFDYQIEESGKVKSILQSAIDKIAESAGRIAMETYKKP